METPSITNDIEFINNGDIEVTKAGTLTVAAAGTILPRIVGRPPAVRTIRRFGTTTTAFVSSVFPRASDGSCLRLG